MARILHRLYQMAGMAGLSGMGGGNGGFPGMAGQAGGGFGGAIPMGGGAGAIDAIHQMGGAGGSDSSSSMAETLSGRGLQQLRSFQGTSKCGQRVSNLRPDHIRHAMVQYGDSTAYFSRIRDRHLRYP